MSEEHEGFDPDGYSVVVKLRGYQPKPWRWEIHRAGRWGTLQSSSKFFGSIAQTSLSRKKSLAQLLAKVKQRGMRPLKSTGCRETPSRGTSLHIKFSAMRNQPQPSAVHFTIVLGATHAPRSGP